MKHHNIDSSFSIISKQSIEIPFLASSQLLQSNGLSARNVVCLLSILLFFGNLWYR